MPGKLSALDFFLLHDMGSVVHGGGDYFGPIFEFTMKMFLEIHN